MSTQTLAADKIRVRGVQVLTRELGAAGMVQFMQQFRNGRGDYTKERNKLLGHLTVDQVVAEIRHKRVRR
jgi:hypothetical protein